MEDFLQQYRKQKVLKNAGIIAASLFLAIGVNIQLTDSNFNQYIKSNILESQEAPISKSDLYLEIDETSLIIKNGVAIQDLQQVQFSLLYNHESLNVINISNTVDNYTINQNYIDYGILNIQLNSENFQDIAAHTSLLKIDFEKNTEMKEYINILNANFSDGSGKTYLLNTSGASL